MGRRGIRTYSSSTEATVLHLEEVDSGSPIGRGSPRAFKLKCSWVRVDNVASGRIFLLSPPPNSNGPADEEGGRWMKRRPRAGRDASENWT